jgi:hypothetical protein
MADERPQLNHHPKSPKLKTSACASPMLDRSSINTLPSTTLLVDANASCGYTLILGPGLSGTATKIRRTGCCGKFLFFSDSWRPSFDLSRDLISISRLRLGRSGVTSHPQSGCRRTVANNQQDDAAGRGPLNPPKSSKRALSPRDMPLQGDRPADRKRSPSRKEKNKNFKVIRLGLVT